MSLTLKLLALLFSSDSPAQDDIARANGGQNPATVVERWVRSRWLSLRCHANE
jgi:hypothetical protein